MAKVERPLSRRVMMVLNDGTTYTELDGCCIIDVPEQIDDSEVDEFIKDAIKTRSPSVLTVFVQAADTRPGPG